MVFLRLSAVLAVTSLLVASNPLARAAPSDAAAVDAHRQLAFSLPEQPVFNWIHSTLNEWMPKKTQAHSLTNADDASFYSSLGAPDYSDKTIWQVVQENEHLTDFKRVLKYSGPRTKKLLDDKEKKLTFLVPVNWHHRHHRRDGQEHLQLESESAPMLDLNQWSKVEMQINDLERDEDKNDGEKERRRKAIAFLIDATVEYHAIESKEPLKAWDVSQNSSVATLLSIGSGRAREVLGNLLDGNPFRLRVGKSLLPRPSAYFNFYSRLVFPDVNVGGSIVHAISLPLLIPPSTWQTLFFSQPSLAGTLAALQKTRQSAYLHIPFNHSALHHHDGDINGDFAMLLGQHHEAPISLDGTESPSMADMTALREMRQNTSRHARRGQTDLTLFTPTNVAWYRLPPLFRLFLMSPFGGRVLSKVLALHALPHTIFYADFVDVRHASKGEGLIGHESMPASQLVQSSEWLWGPRSASPAVPFGEANVTRYTFKTACPKIHYNHTSTLLEDVEDEADHEKVEFETVDVNVYRYHILPGGRGPLQTRVSVQGVPVSFPDIPTSNGALHTIDRFIMPKHHPEKGVWAEVAQEAEKYGYGKVDWESMMV